MEEMVKELGAPYDEGRRREAGSVLNLNLFWKICVLRQASMMEIYRLQATKLFLISEASSVFVVWWACNAFFRGHGQASAGGLVVWLDQKIVLRALDLDVGLSKDSLKIPFSDLLIAAVALKVEGEPVTLDERHFKRVKGLKVYIPRPTRNPPH
jgi:hypothetical protein